MQNTKKMYADLKAFAEKTHADKKQFEHLKKDMDKLHSVIREGGNIMAEFKAVMPKYPELMRIYIDSDTHDEAGCIIIIIIIIIVIVVMSSPEE